MSSSSGPSLTRLNPKVVTEPPWAIDEPPSPKDIQPSLHETTSPFESRPSDVASFLSGSTTSNSRWWTFAPNRNREPLLKEMSILSRPDRKGFAERSKAWLNSPLRESFRENTAFGRKHEKPETVPENESIDQRWSSQISPPTPASHAQFRKDVPHWDTIPWTPQVSGPSFPARTNTLSSSELEGAIDGQNRERTPWSQRRKRLRHFILTNTYVPLLFRFMNIIFTSAALAMAIQIRRLEVKHKVMGALGSSPTVVIIFAPLTLLHVMAAIYLEYFGRPLGLWRTSGKLTHTLSEVLFICAWSAALSLCFDNFFTSLVPCASPSHLSWYNQLPRPTHELPIFEHSFGEQICDDQLSLICLVGVGLLVYCANLIISLFRIFEKVKYHPAAAPEQS